MADEENKPLQKETDSNSQTNNNLGQPIKDSSKKKDKEQVKNSIDIENNRSAHNDGAQDNRNNIPGIDPNGDEPPKPTIDENDAIANNPQPPFQISKNCLSKIAYACQDRYFAEEVELLEQNGGNEWVERGLCTSFKNGLPGTQDDWDNRNRAFGNNRKPEVEPKGFIELLCDALEDFTLRILILASFFSIAIEVGTAEPEKRSSAWIEGFAILVAVIVCALVTSVNDYQKERQFQKLNKVADERKVVTLIRNGQLKNIHQSEVMVGDVVQLTEGMEIPADGYLIEAAELTTDESAMTGETDPVKKKLLPECIAKKNQMIDEGSRNTAAKHDVPSPIIMSGTRILTGEGKMIVFVVGDSSCIGKISALLRQSDPEATPLQMKLEAIARDIGNFGLISACLIVLVLLVRFAIERGTENEWDHSHHWKELLEFFIIGITVVVVAIPEGLPLSVTLSLAYSVKKMLNDQNLVRKLQACETMGGANMICSDKTGTLTMNKMTLTKWWNNQLSDLKPHADKQTLSDYMPIEFYQLFLQALACNSSAQLRPDEKGSKTEIAFLQFIDKADIKYEDLRGKWEVIQKFPFSSARKRMGIILNTEEGHILHEKGASEMVLKACTHFHNKDTKQIEPITEELKQKMEQAIKSMADEALRTIVCGYRKLSGNEDLATKDRLGVFDVETHDLTLLGIFGIKDIIRKEVPPAVEQCRRAGIKVRMVTGDNKDTARAIAKECHIIDPNDPQSIVMEGPEFIQRTGGVVCTKCRTFECPCPRDADTAKKQNKEVRVDTIANGAEFDKIYPHLDVMARSRPEDKYALVTGLIERENVVAVTGDGTNDAPALKKADVGFAMGIAGTEVAREAAAIILLDDNFKSIVAAVMWGRNIYDSIKKFLQFQLTVNVVAVFITLIGAAIIQMKVLQPIQMLWINLIMDTLASLALATEPPTEELLERKPHNRKEYIISKKMFKHIFGQAIFQLILLMIFVFGGPQFLPEWGDQLDIDILNKCFDKVNMQVNCRSTSGWLIMKDPKDRFENWWEYKWEKKPEIKNPDLLTSSIKESNFSPFVSGLTGFVRSGKEKTYGGERDYIKILEEFDEPSRHFTYVFNLFVMMQVFNFLNARKLRDELNIFEGLTRNNLFIIIVILIIILQIILITFAGYAFKVYKYYGLRVEQWLICIAFAIIGNIVSIFLKFIPEEQCIQIGKKEVDPLHSKTQVLSLKGSRNEHSINRKFSVLGQIPAPRGSIRSNLPHGVTGQH